MIPQNHKIMVVFYGNLIRKGLHLQILLLAAALVVGHALTKQRVTWLGEAGAALLLGVGTGIFCQFSSVSDTYLSWIAFKKEASSSTVSQAALLVLLGNAAPGMALCEK